MTPFGKFDDLQHTCKPRFDHANFFSTRPIHFGVKLAITGFATGSSIGPDLPKLNLEIGSKVWRMLFRNLNWGYGDPKTPKKTG